MGPKPGGQAGLRLRPLQDSVTADAATDYNLVNDYQIWLCGISCA